MTPEASSSVAVAVATLAKATERTSEARLHLDYVAAAMSTIREFYGLAAGGSPHALMHGAAGAAAEAQVRVRESMSLIARADEALKTYVAAIAPALSFLGPAYAESLPSGDELLLTSRRPRSLKSWADEGIRQVGNVEGLMKEAADTATRFGGAPPGPPPPDQSHTSTTYPVAQHHESPQTGGPDPLVALSVVGLLAFKTAQSVGDKVVSHLLRRWHR